jgi:hypothetical protein
MAAIDSALIHLQTGTDDLLSPARLDQLARDSGIAFRNTTLTPGNTLALFIRQIAHGNIACAAVRHLAGRDFTDVAWCQARQRLSDRLIHQLNAQVLDTARRAITAPAPMSSLSAPHCNSPHWHGHRVVVIDGSSDSMPDTPALRQHYGVPGASKLLLGFPTSHLILLMDHHSGIMLDCHDLPGDTHDASVAHLTHHHLQEGDVVLGDDAFASYLHLAMLLQAKAHAIMPAQHRRVVDFTPGRDYVPMSRNSSKASAAKPRSQQVKILGPNDQLVRYFKPPNKPQWMTAERWQSIPDSIVVREIRRTIARNGFRPITVTVVTTLLDDHMYAADEIVELRLSRWLIETNLRHLKVTLGMDHLKCKTLEGVRKERMVFLLVYNLIRLVMLTAAARQKTSPNRLSFADTLAWLTLAAMTHHPGTPPRLKVNRLRPGRLEPRAIKRGGNSFPYMTRPRRQLQLELLATYGDTT